LLTETALPDHRHLRPAWFTAAGAQRTLVASGADGRPLAAFPLHPAGPAQLGASAVAGAYWPFRMPLLSERLEPGTLAKILRHPDARSAFGPLWRVGPFYADDAASLRLVEAARLAGWTVLTRRLGHSWVLEIAAAGREEPWPRRSTLRRIGNYERQLARLGTISWERIEGAGWTSSVFDDLATVEAASWVGTATDGKGAKFVNLRNRAMWEAAARDPVLADMMSALILRVDGRPVAFCFDLNVGDLQYSIAGSYAADLAKLKVGKIATYRNIAWAMERGIGRIDWGAGDSGYKSEIGALRGPEIVDCLFVRHPLLALLLRSKWERAAPREGETASWLPIGRREMLVIASIAAAAAVGAMSE
jgi:hypothetical protein